MTKRWDCLTDDEAENKKVDAFIEEIIKVCKKHNFSICHEDAHGGFIIERYHECCDEDLRGASMLLKDNTTKSEEV